MSKDKRNYRSQRKIPPSGKWPLMLLLTQRFLTLRCVWCVKIKDTDDVLPVKDGLQFPDGNYFFEFCPSHAAHAWKSLSEK